MIERVPLPFDPVVKFKKLHPDAKIPQSYTEESVGLDLHAFLQTENGRKNNMLIPPRTVRNVPTGLQVEAPRKYFLVVCSRSGLAKNGLFVANAPGIIDPDYRGEIKVLLYNGGYEAYYVQHEQRIAQLILLPAPRPLVVESWELSKTERGEKGFGSTGDY